MGRTTGEVVGSILLTGDQLFRVEQLTVSTRADLIDDRRLQINEDAARNVLAGARLGEEGVERVVATTDRLVRRHLAVRLDPVLQAEEPGSNPVNPIRNSESVVLPNWSRVLQKKSGERALPTGIPNLRARLAHVDEDRLTHGTGCLEVHESWSRESRPLATQ